MSPFSPRRWALKIFAETLGLLALGLSEPCAFAIGTNDFYRIDGFNDVFSPFSSKNDSASSRPSNGFFDDRFFNADEVSVVKNDDERNVGAALDRSVGTDAPAWNAELSNVSASAFDLSVEEFAAVDSFAPVGTPVRSSGVVGTDGVSFSQEPIIRGSMNLPKLSSIQIWGNGYIGAGDIRPEHWDGELSEKTTGATIGLTVPFGAASGSGYYNYNQNRLRYSGRQVTQKTHLFGLGAYIHAGGFYFTLLGTYGSDAYSAIKTADVPGVYNNANFDGMQSSGYFESGYEWPTLGLFVLKPFVSYQYSYAKHDDFNGANFALGGGDDDTYDACYMTLGSRIDVNLAGMDSFTLQLRSAWTTQLRSDAESMQNFCFGRIPGTLSPSQPYFVGDGAGSDFFWGGLGLRLSLFGAFSVAGDYDCLVNSRQTLHVGSLALLVGF